MTKANDARETRTSALGRSPLSARQLLLPEHLEALWRPLLTPEAFFSDLSRYLTRISPGFLLVFWGVVTSAVVLLFTGSGVDAANVGSGVPPVAVQVVTGILQALGSGLFALLMSFLPAVLLHVTASLIITGYKDNLLAAWRIIAFLTIPLVALTVFLTALRAIPSAGAALYILLAAALVVLIVNSLRTALTVLYGAGAVRAAAAAVAAVLPLGLLVLASSMLILRG